MADVQWTYQRVTPEGTVVECPINDLDGSVTGLANCAVFGVKAWLDAHPEAARAGGWIKLIKHDTSEVDYDPQTQYLTKIFKRIDEWTIEEVYTVSDKSEEMLLYDEMADLHYAPYHDITHLNGGYRCPYNLFG